MKKRKGMLGIIMMILGLASTIGFADEAIVDDDGGQTSEPSDPSPTGGHCAAGGC